MSTDTVNGRALSVASESGEQSEVTLREIRVRDYARARALIDREPALLDIACGKPAGWSETLTPESYDRVASAMREVNALFFGYCVRAAQTQLALLPNDILRNLVATDSNQSSPRPASPPASVGMTR